MSLTTAVSEDDDGESVHNSPYKVILIIMMMIMMMIMRIIMMMIMRIIMMMILKSVMMNKRTSPGEAERFSSLVQLHGSRQKSRISFR